MPTLSRGLLKAEFALGVLLFAVIVTLVFAASVMRFFNHPLIWSVDLAQLLFIWLCFVGAVRAARDRAHLGLDLLVSRCSHRCRLVIETVLATIFVVFLLVLAWEGYKLTLLNLERVFGDSGLSYAFVTIAVPAGCILLALTLLSNAIDAWRRRADETILIFARLPNPAEPNPVENAQEVP